MEARLGLIALLNSTWSLNVRVVATPGLRDERSWDGDAKGGTFWLLEVLYLGTGCWLPDSWISCGVSNWIKWVSPQSPR